MRTWLIDRVSDRHRALVYKTCGLLVAFYGAAWIHGQLIVSGDVPNDIPTAVWEEAQQRSKAQSCATLRTGPGLSPEYIEEVCGDVDFEVHEWGTFTAFQGSDGLSRTNIAYEEHVLPPFTYQRVKRLSAISACLNELPTKSGPTCMQRMTNQKMETPVIYFYGGPDRVEVDVRFPRGVISSWYPYSPSWGPEPGSCYDDDGFAWGQMSWDVELLSPDDTSRIVPVSEDDIWAPSRRVPDARVVRTGDEYEKFIFYRGLGNFELPLTVKSSAQGYELAGGTGEVIMLTFDGQHGGVHVAGGTTTVGADEMRPELERTQYLRMARALVAKPLRESGLTDAEVEAMLDTWEHSYFTLEGTRALYLLPRQTVDALLPLAIKPTPDRIVRTMIARVEIMPLDEERRLVDEVRAAVAAGSALEVDAVDRFFEARLLRVRELLGTRAELRVVDDALERFRTRRDELGLDRG